jgi:hypothetical protein
MRQFENSPKYVAAIAHACHDGIAVGRVGLSHRLADVAATAL